MFVGDIPKGIMMELNPALQKMVVGKIIIIFYETIENVMVVANQERCMYGC
jgi:hypothetical protein